MNKNVSLKFIEEYDINMVEETVQSIIDGLNFSNVIKPKMKVLLKPCLPMSESPDKATSTHPVVVRALANVLSKMGAQCIIAESPYGKFSTKNLEDVYLNTGMLEVNNLTKCELNTDLRTHTFETPKGVMSKNLTLLQIVNEVDAIINIGKVKLDNQLGYFGACANLFGLVPGDMKTQMLNRFETAKDFNNCILDIYDVLKDKIVLNVLDGIVSLEAGNTQRMLSCIGVAENIFSLDAAMVDVLGLGYKNTILRQARERGMFEFDKSYKLIHERIEKFVVLDYAVLEYNENTKLHTDTSAQKRYYKRIQCRPTIPQNKCKGCGICSKICPTGAILMKYDKNGELFAEIDYKKCILCKKCHTACPYQLVDMITPLGYKKFDKAINKYNQEKGE